MTLVHMIQGIDVIMRRLRSRFIHESSGKGRRHGCIDVVRASCRNLWIIPLFVAIMLCSMFLTKMVIRLGKKNATDFLEFYHFRSSNVQADCSTACSRDASRSSGENTCSGWMAVSVAMKHKDDDYPSTHHRRSMRATAYPNCTGQPLHLTLGCLPPMCMHLP